jgi:hypothetical protein
MGMIGGLPGQTAVTSPSVAAPAGKTGGVSAGGKSEQHGQAAGLAHKPALEPKTSEQFKAETDQLRSEFKETKKAYISRHNGMHRSFSFKLLILPIISGCVCGLLKIRSSMKMNAKLKAIDAKIAEGKARGEDVDNLTDLRKDFENIEKLSKKSGHFHSESKHIDTGHKQ